MRFPTTGGGADSYDNTLEPVLCLCRDESRTMTRVPWHPTSTPLRRLGPYFGGMSFVRPCKKRPWQNAHESNHLEYCDPLRKNKNISSGPGFHTPANRPGRQYGVLALVHAMPNAILHVSALHHIPQHVKKTNLCQAR